ncbi:hypothetical protein V3C99_007821 [Haemonchus contortus]
MESSEPAFPDVHMWSYLISSAFFKDFAGLFLIFKDSVVDAFRRIYYSRYERRISDAKRKDRPELIKPGWSRLNLAKTFSLPPLEDKMPRVDCSTLTVEEFREKYEQPRVPCMITGLTKSWKAHNNWKIDNLLQKYGNAMFKCGENSNSKPILLKMKYYAEYMSKTKDDSPLYIFDGQFGERPATSDMLNDYEVPVYFQNNLFDVLGSHKLRPAFRWITIGPARSGTNIHVDPFGTSAWNALIHGHKRWVFIHPDAPRELVRIPKDQRGIHPLEAVTWFSTVYERICKGDWPFEKYPVMECRQNPGETLFVPCGWWHVVINEDVTVAVTQNFCSPANLRFVYPTLAKQRPCTAQLFYERLSEQHPELLDIVNETMLDPKPIRNGYDTSDDSGSEDEEDESHSTITLNSTDVSSYESESSGEDEENLRQETIELKEMRNKTEEGVADTLDDGDKSSYSSKPKVAELNSPSANTGTDSETEEYSGGDYDSYEEDGEIDELSEDEEVLRKMPMSGLSGMKRRIRENS